jgi:multiple sugar transport system permease protein
MDKFRSERANTFILILPWVITLGIFWLYPLLYALFMSFTEYSTLTDSFKYVGFENYSAIVSDNIFWKALSNTAIFTFGTVPVTTFLAIFPCCACQ